MQVVQVQPRTATQRAHNLTINTLHTYHVLASASAVLVHNCPVSAGGEKAAKRGRAEDLQPHAEATGSHTVFERDAEGKVIRYQTWEMNERAPSGWQKGPRFRGTGGLHSNIEPPIYYPTGGGKAVAGAEVPENIPPGYLP
ncbi:polymorphic toxin type 24 domain-containing protein [Goodfellowiella coeruleoviolacea]|uniref:polymorphic toxin type 24 domain-containing protein n=1 Tax=Goodfellowiella coeruleoviolacea TaxID=334858 RepID=UPI0038992B8B